MYNFEMCKKEYEKARDCEKNKLMDFLKNKGIKVLNKGHGNGISQYTSGGKLEVSYDLSNWKWVEIEKEGYKYLISLQPFDKDKKTGNIHVLMDRIGIYKYKEYVASEAMEKMVITNIELPLTEEKLNELLTLF